MSSETGTNGKPNDKATSQPSSQPSWIEMVLTPSVKTFFRFCAFLAAAAVYTCALEPLTCLVFESRPLRYKVQRYLFRPVEAMLDKALNSIVEYECSGDAKMLQTKGLTAVFANHQGVIDYLILLHFGKKCGIQASSFFFVYKHCVRLPSLRVLYNMWRQQTNWRVPAMSLAETFAPILESPWVNDGGKWVIVFPEVSSWSATGMLEDRAECVEQGCPKLKVLLYPRFNAFVQTVTYLRDFPVNDVFDVSIIYTSENKVELPSWQDLLFGKKWKVYIDVKRFATTSLPQKEKHLVRWFEQQWFRKDNSIAEFKLRLSSQKKVTK